MNVTLRPLYSQERERDSQWNRGWVGPRVSLSVFGDERIFCYDGIRTAVSSACSLNALPIMLAWPHFNPLNPELNPICYLLALLGAYHFLHVSRIRVKILTFRRLMSYIYIYIYGAPILDVSRSHTTTQHSR